MEENPIREEIIWEKQRTVNNVLSITSDFKTQWLRRANIFHPIIFVSQEVQLLYLLLWEETWVQFPSPYSCSQSSLTVVGDLTSFYLFIYFLICEWEPSTHIGSCTNVKAKHADT